MNYRSHGDDPPPKATLWCPECGHESAADGDWQAHEHCSGGSERRTLVCPDCGTAVVSQPVLAAPA